MHVGADFSVFCKRDITCSSRHRKFDRGLHFWRVCVCWGVGGWVRVWVGGLRGGGLRYVRTIAALEFKVDFGDGTTEDNILIIFKTLIWHSVKLSV